jgi:predicted DNA-binding transcriptional regulator AlpA
MTLLTEQDVAGILRKSLSYVQHMRSEGGGPRYLKIGHSVRYRQEDVDSWLAERARSRVWELDKDTFEPVGDAAKRVVDKLPRRSKKSSAS